MSTSFHRPSLLVVVIAGCLLAYAPWRVAASAAPEDLHRAVVTMHDLSLSLRVRLDGVTDPVERSRRVRVAVREHVVETIDLELGAELACVSQAYLAVSGPGSDEESVYEFVFMEIVRRLSDDSSARARSELQELRSTLVVDGASALFLHEAFMKHGMKW